MDLMKLLQEGDATGLEMQKALEALDLAKISVEQAKERFDLTKNFFEQVIARAEEAGIARAKFKKLVEERVAGLWNSGLMNQGEERLVKPSKLRVAKKSKSLVSGASESAHNNAVEGDVHTSGDESFEVEEAAMAN